MSQENENEAKILSPTTDFLPSDGASCSVWIVTGETGRHSDYSEWNVAAFTTEEMANHFRDLCQNEADKVNISKDYDILDGFKHAYDTQFYCDYNGTKYRVAIVEVFSSSPPNAGSDAPGETEAK